MAKLTSEILVIGIGSTLRNDDAVGQRAALAVERWGLPGISSLAVVQLTPDLAEPISSASAVIFIDAGPADQLRDLVDLAPIEPFDETTSSAIGHSSDPRSLLALAREVFGRCPRAWLVTIPAADFSFGEQLSTIAADGLAVALDQIASLIATI